MYTNPSSSISGSIKPHGSRPAFGPVSGIGLNPTSRPAFGPMSGIGFNPTSRPAFIEFNPTSRPAFGPKSGIEFNPTSRPAFGPVSGIGLNPTSRPALPKPAIRTMSIQTAKDACGPNGIKSYTESKGTSGGVGPSGIHGKRETSESFTCHSPKAKEVQPKQPKKAQLKM